MEYPTQRRGIQPWVWVLIVLAAVLLVFVIWWAVAAQGPRETVIIAPEEKEVERPPAEAPAKETPAEQPVVVERERPVNIYIEREQPRPNVIIVPRDAQRPVARERLRQVDLPSRFRYQRSVWEPSDQAVGADSISLKDTGASVDGNIVYAEQDGEPPYSELYLETEPGSGVFIKYLPS